MSISPYAASISAWGELPRNSRRGSPMPRCGNRHAVGDQKIHAVEARRVEVIEPCDDDRCGFPRNGTKPVARCMPCQVNQNVDAVRTDSRRQRGVVVGTHIAPRISMATKLI